MICLSLALLIAGLHGATWAWIVALVCGVVESVVELLG